jgi:hypothetical protein
VNTEKTVEAIIRKHLAAIDAFSLHKLALKVLARAFGTVK